MCLTDEELLEVSDTMSRQSNMDDSDADTYIDGMKEEIEKRKNLQTTFIPVTGVLGFLTAYKYVIWKYLD